MTKKIISKQTYELTLIHTFDKKKVEQNYAKKWRHLYLDIETICCNNLTKLRETKIKK